MSAAALRAERIAIAIVNGDVSMSDAIEDLRLANREREVERQSQALTAFRSGEAPWVFPTHAPWSGF